MSPEVKQAFDEWKARANTGTLLSVALKFGAKLRRTGRELVGPCPRCKGKDRFQINEGNRVWLCRGFGGGDRVAMAMHLGGLSFMEACEELSGEPPPRGKAKPLSDEERRRRADELARREADQRAFEADQERNRARRESTAKAIWGKCHPIAGTVAERYLTGRGLPVPPDGWPDVVGFHPGLEWELGSVWEKVNGVDRKVRPGPTFPCLVARVQDVAGETTAIWRIFINPDTAAKAPIEKPKVGLGDAAGGAVRLGGVGRKIGATEGLETGFGAWALIGWRYPVWPTLSTSGMKGVELPLDVEELVIFPDGDRRVKRQRNEHGFDEYLPEPNPPGISAARVLRDRTEGLGVKARIQAEPEAGTDYLDVWNSVKQMAVA